MIKFLKLDPDKMRIHLALLKDLFKPRFPEPKKSQNPQGAPRKCPRWLIVALGVLGAVLDYTWLEYTDQLQTIEEVLLEFGAVQTLKKTSLYDAGASKIIKTIFKIPYRGPNEIKSDPGC